MRALALASLASLGALVLGACKTDDAKPAARKTEPTATSRPGSAAAAPATTTGPVEDHQPTIAGATLLQVRTKTDRQATQIWCIDLSAGRDAAVRVADTLRADGWLDVTSRGAADRFGVAGSKSDLRISATVGGRDERCNNGTLVITTIARLGAPLVIPPTTDPIR